MVVLACWWWWGWWLDRQALDIQIHAGCPPSSSNLINCIADGCSDGPRLDVPLDEGRDYVILVSPKIPIPPPPPPPPPPPLIPPVVITVIPVRHP